MKNELDSILEICCNVTDCNVNAVKGKSRDRDLVNTRNLFYYFSKIHKDNIYSLTSIGNKVDKTHTNVMHGIKTVRNFISINDKSTLKFISEIQNSMDDNLIKIELLIDRVKSLDYESIILFREKLDKTIEKLKK